MASVQKPRHALSLDIGSNSVGSAWIDRKSGEMSTGVSVFPAGVDETDDKRGEPKNAKRRMTRRTRITLRRRAERKRVLRARLIEVGLLPKDAAAFKLLLEETDAWELRRHGLDRVLTPYEFGRVLLHLAQRRGALGLKLPEDDEQEATPADDGKVKKAIGEVRAKMLSRKSRTFGEFIASVRAERVHPITSKDQRPKDRRIGERVFRTAIRNKAGSYEHCADRGLIRDEFAKLWEAQRKLSGKAGPLAGLLTETLRVELDDERGDDVWKHKGLLFGQRRQTWDLGVLGRCVLEPTERCVPHADMYASRYRVVETVNNIKVIEHGKPERPLSPEERAKIIAYLRGPLGVHEKGKQKGKAKNTVSVTDLREQMGWGKATKAARFRFNIEADEDREINTDWFNREIVHGAVGEGAWAAMPERVREGFNHAILKFNPEDEGDEEKFMAGITTWGGLDAGRTAALISAWKRRPKPDNKRLNMSRKAVRNILTLMDRSQPCPDSKSPSGYAWLTQIAARKLIAEDGDFRDVTTGQPMDEHARRRYATGAKGLSARDRHYIKKHSGDTPTLPPAPKISNPVVRKAIHEVRRHVMEYMREFKRKPDEVYIELAREAKMGKVDADRVLFRNRLRERIRKDIIESFKLYNDSSTQQRAAVDRVVLCVQQGGICPLCGDQSKSAHMTTRAAAKGDNCELAHILPRASGGENGYRNLVLAHTKCNRDMARQTPHQYFDRAGGPGFEAGVRWVEGIYGEVRRSPLKEYKTAEGDALWSMYFREREDAAKIEQFKKDIKDIGDMTARQEAATKYAARQVMAYLADALYEGKGLPERGGERRIYAGDGLWTSRLRREWGLFFDSHDAKAKGLSNKEEHERKEKNRADHRHHAIDAVVIGLCTQEVRSAWERRELEALKHVKNPADQEELEHYRRQNPITLPHPFKSRDELRDSVKRAIFGDNGAKDSIERPVSHRPVKRKLIGALHEESLFGPVLDAQGNLTGNYTAKKPVSALTPNHLRMPEGWDALEAKLHDGRTSEPRKRAIRRELAQMEDPSPGKSGIVRDRALRNQLRRCLRSAKLDPDGFKDSELKKFLDPATKLGFLQASGVPIDTVVLLRTMSDPVIISRRVPDHASGCGIIDDHPGSARAYVGGNNHHIEIRVAKNKKGVDVWSGTIVSAYEAAQRKLAKLRAFKAEHVPKPDEIKALTNAEKKRWSPIISRIEREHPIVNRNDDDALGGRFVMSVSEGEMLLMKHKATGEVGYFVVAKLDKPQSIVVVPHWDARKAGERKDAEGKPVKNSARDDFAVTPGDLKRLAPPGKPHAVKVRVSPLGKVSELDRD